MNRFRTKKRAKDDIAAGRSSQDSESLSMPSFKSFRRGKKSHEDEPKKEIDLSSALPSNDDFRTSLLMTNLSARFSMLREQDDPNTKIGKASDDSVLFPKRQSRLMDYGFGTAASGLSDIAEVESIKAPPSFDRVDSFISDHSGSIKSGTIMNRSKPTEGNNLFGGRQKIYKIPVGASSAKNLGGGIMSGKALYDDDVAVSAFQRWRQAERERASGGENRAGPVRPEEEELEPVRSESPVPVGYNQKRETSSTTSSASGVARNSTAATSVTSQPTASIKDSQSAAVAPSLTASPSALERNVTRARRLYEQGLTQELQDQQSSALSRIDTLSRQRALGSRTPDQVTNSPSPTSLIFSERRQVLTKGSAPNLRSMSPPATASTLAPAMDLGTKAAIAVAATDTRPNLHGTPPLSPPVSETEDHPLLPIQPNDRGKATAMGVFQKPTQPYDESRYAQRQLQLQQGRETPHLQRLRTESDVSLSTSRSHSPSSAHLRFLDTRFDTGVSLESAIKETTVTTFFNDDDDDDDDTEDSPDLPDSAKLVGSPHLLLQRPADDEHPAFRQSALPTPLLFGVRGDTEAAAVSDQTDRASMNMRQRSSGDSPTLGPTAGLSGLVRQHLRSDSNTSSVYGAMPQSSGHESRLTTDAQGLTNTYNVRTNPWSQQEQDWRLSGYSGEPSLEDLKDLERLKESDAGGDLKTRAPDHAGDENEVEADEFANQLANARRRVRQRLTSYVESDSSRPASPVPPPESSRDAADQAPAALLGLGALKPKLSRGSLVDRSKGIVSSHSRAMKKLGVATMSTCPSPTRQMFEDGEVILPASTFKSEPSDEQSYMVGGGDAAADADAVADGEETENTHPGLRAFRQARRELQKRKELEILARRQQQHDQSPQAQQYQPSHRGLPEDVVWDGQGGHNRESQAWQRMPSGETRPPPASYQRRGPSEDSRYPRDAGPGNIAARSPSVDRDMSGSGTDNSRTRSRSRPTFSQEHLGTSGISSVSRQPMLRSPGLPGTDIRRSPIMPPYPYPGATRPTPGLSTRLDRSRSAGNLKAFSPRMGYEAGSGLPSPRLPQNEQGSPAGAVNVPSISTPSSSAPSRRPSAPPSPAFGPSSGPLHESAKRIVDKRDISEPTFIRSTSRVPVRNLVQSHSGSDNNDAGSDARRRSRSGSSSGGGGDGGDGGDGGNSGSHTAPPVPPINPRRRREGSRTGAAAVDWRGGRKDEELDGEAFTPPRPPFVGMARHAGESDDEDRSSLSVSDDEAAGKSASIRNRLRKVQAEVQALNARSAATNGRPRDAGPTFIVKGPPASRTMVTTNLKRPGMGVPGGLI